MNLDELRACLAAPLAMADLVCALDRADGDYLAEWDRALAAYADERARNIAQALVAEDHALREAVEALCREAEDAIEDCKRLHKSGACGQCGHMRGTVERVRALLTEGT